jgi:hypothetical protein
MTESDKEFAGPLMKILENVGQEVPKGLLELAKTSKWYAENANKTNNFSARAHIGLGYVEKQKHHTNDPAALLAKPSFSRPQVSNVNKAIEKAKNVAESSTGVGLSRYDTMRKVLKVNSQCIPKLITIFRLHSKEHSQKLRRKIQPQVAFTDPRVTPNVPRSNEAQPEKKRSRWN